MPPFLNPNEKIDKRFHRLPHWQQNEASQFVTWRLADSIPKDKFILWEQEKDIWLRSHPEPWDELTQNKYYTLFEDRLAKWMDCCEGSCIFRAQEIRNIVQNALQYFDRIRYNLWTFVIMPNHIHALFSIRAPHSLAKILHGWKGFTAKEINRRLSTKGHVWQDGYWDQLIRNRKHFEACANYIRCNPMKAGLSKRHYTVFESIEIKGNGMDE